MTARHIFTALRGAEGELVDVARAADLARGAREATAIAGPAA